MIEPTANKATTPPPTSSPASAEDTKIDLLNTPSNKLSRSQRAEKAALLAKDATAPKTKTGKTLPNKPRRERPEPPKKAAPEPKKGKATPTPPTKAQKPAPEPKKAAPVVKKAAPPIKVGPPPEKPIFREGSVFAEVYERLRSGQEYDLMTLFTNLDAAKRVADPARVLQHLIQRGKLSGEFTIERVAGKSGTVRMTKGASRKK